MDILETESIYFIMEKLIKQFAHNMYIKKYKYMFFIGAKKRNHKYTSNDLQKMKEMEKKRRTFDSHFFTLKLSS